MDISPLHIQKTLDNLKASLLAQRTPEGWWEGRLSSSALSTAVAVVALALVRRNPAHYVQAPLQGDAYEALIHGGLAWLVRTQNHDGGWGDTDRSESNISTALLCWAAFGAAEGGEAAFPKAVRNVEGYIRSHAGSLEPNSVAETILARYGKDRTFSVPILTCCALAGRLGAPDEAWRWVKQLPFELAMFPHSFFAWLRLPVVSYALPALIAIGQARHAHRPTRNPPLRWLRNASCSKTLRLLRNIQPESGGYLEATPLTSFVTMSLTSFIHEPNPVVEAGLRFLVESVRVDGSWPIDTNLATWVTTLSVNALAQNPRFAEEFSDKDRRRWLEWLLAQQYRAAHPYTNAAPGGWAWTHLSGGVPDADDTSGALLALRNLAIDDARLASSASAGLQWLMDLQNRDGGIPTFCRGWANLPFDRSCADITAHALRALSLWRGALPERLLGRARRFERAALAFLRQTQTAQGAWAPLWFGNEREPERINWTYGTAQVVAALAANGCTKTGLGEMLSGGVEWLLAAQRPDGGWGGAPGLAPSIEETALAVSALAAGASVLDDDTLREDAVAAVMRGANWLVEGVEHGRSVDAAPIGFYFAELWYYEDLYPLIFSIGALESALVIMDQTI